MCEKQSPTCGCHPPTRWGVIARYSDAVYTNEHIPKGTTWECWHGRMWRAKSDIHAPTVWRLLSPRQERRARRKLARR